MKPEDVKPLENWLTLPEVAEILGVTSRQAVHKMIFEQNLFSLDEVRVIGQSRAYLLSSAAVYELKKMRDTIAKERAEIKDAQAKFKELKSLLK